MDKLVRWGREHPVLDGMVFGPILLANAVWMQLVGWIDLHLAWFAVILLAGVGLGALMGLRRGRRLRGA